MAFSPGSRLPKLCLLLVPAIGVALLAPSAPGDGARTLFRDSSAAADPKPIWGRVDCSEERGTRLRQGLLGGDMNSRTDGSVLGQTAFRRLLVFDGDDVSGERCELGLNDWRDGPTALYHEGQRRVTYVSLRLPETFPLGTRRWQTVIQMKQTQPADDGGGPPMISIEARHGKWRLNVSTGRESSDWTRWKARARRGVWTRFILDVFYSRSPHQGWVRLFADRNGDGDIEDAGERSGLIRGQTLKQEGPDEGGNDGIPAGRSIPSHLRVGIYHDKRISCPEGCAVDVDSVRVVSKPTP
jgi:hypothetical protein